MDRRRCCRESKCNGMSRDMVLLKKMSRRRGRNTRAMSRVRWSLRMKVRKLQRLIPGGRGLQPNRLFLRTADYIFQLKFKVLVLQALSNLYMP